MRAPPHPAPSSSPPHKTEVPAAHPECQHLREDPTPTPVALGQPIPPLRIHTWLPVLSQEPSQDLSGVVFLLLLFCKVLSFHLV